MKLRHTPTGCAITVSRYLYNKEFRDNSDWVDITPPRTNKQVAASDRFVRLGKLHRTKSNLQEVIRTFGHNHGLFLDTIIALDKLIRSINAPKP